MAKIKEAQETEVLQNNETIAEGTENPTVDNTAATENENEGQGAELTKGDTEGTPAEEKPAAKAKTTKAKAAKAKTAEVVEEEGEQPPAEILEYLEKSGYEGVYVDECGGMFTLDTPKRFLSKQAKLYKNPNYSK